MNYDWDFGAVWAYRQMLLEGALGTMQIAAVAILMGVVIGALLATMRLSKRALAGVSGPVVHRVLPEHAAARALLLGRSTRCRWSWA